MATPVEVAPSQFGINESSWPACSPRSSAPADWLNSESCPRWNNRSSGVHRLFEAIAIGLRFASAIEIELTSCG
jgi:hypothetical protein